MFLILILYAVSVSTFLVSKNLLFYVSPFMLVGLRTFFSGSIMLSYLYFRKQFTNTLFKNNSSLFMQIAFFSFFIINFGV